MDIDSFLDIEKRTKIGKGEIDDFVSKASAVEEAIRAMRDGKIAPEDVKVEGIDTEEEKQEKERKRLERREQLRREEEELRIKRKQEEKERWWAGAELFAGHDPSADDDADAEEGAVTAEQQRRNRYSMDYSRWDVWDPQDPASLQERMEKEAAADEVANAEFESNNAEFCQQFKEDMEKRKRTTEKKKQSSNQLKLKGNKYFKVKKYDEALEQYMEALKLSPYDGVAIVTNIAQSNIKLKNYDDALEFLNRALYLQPGNVKALSRKAFVLGECVGGTANIEEAIVCAEKAIKLDPANTEVDAQLKELRILLADIRSEEKVRNIASGPQKEKLSALRQDVASVASASGTLGSSGHPAVEDMAKICETLLSDMVVGTEEGGGDGDMATAAGFYLVDDFKTRLDGMAATICPDRDAHTSEQQSTESKLSVEAKKDAALTEAVEGLLTSDKSCRVYFRTTGAWEVLLQVVKAISSHSLLFSRSDDAEEEENIRHVLTLLGPLLKVLRAGAQGERASLLSVAGDAQFLPAIKSVLTRTDAPVEVLHACILFVSVCVDDCCSKLRALVNKDKTLLIDFGAVLCHLNDVISGRLSHCSKEQKGIAGAAVVDCCKFIRDLTFSDEWKKSMTELSIPIVPILGSTLHTRKQWKNTLSEKNSVIVVEVLLESLLGCSQSELLRQAFTMPLDSETFADVTTVHSVVDLCKKEKWACANGLAILMNVTIQDNESTRRLVLDAGGLDVCLSILQGAPVAGEEYARVRAIGLLSRLSTLAEVQECIRQPEVYRSLCSAFLQNTAAEKVDGAYEKWVLDERSQLVRTIASVSSPSEACLSSGGQLGMVQALLGCLPMPRTELLKITATSVTLPPHETINPILLGNIARCLMPYADHKVYSATLYTDKKNLGVEKLVCMMASCTDMRVRKNIAILMAKGCRIPSAKTRIEELRGLQMLVELQDKF